MMYNAGYATMIIDDFVSAGLHVIAGYRPNEYIVELKRPGKCACGGYASQVGQQAARDIIDVVDNRPTHLRVMCTRYRCNTCKKYMQSEDIAIVESIIPAYKLCSDDATAHYIRHMLQHPELQYEDLAELYDVSASTIYKSFRILFDEAKQDIYPLVPCVQLILYPYRHRRKKLICVFGSDSSGKTGALDIIPQDEICMFLLWLHRIKEYGIPKQVVCALDYADKVVDAVDPCTKVALLGEDLVSYEQYIAARLGEKFVSQIKEVTEITSPIEFKDKLDRLCNTIPTKRRCRNEAFVDDVKIYAHWYRSNATYDNEYIQRTIEDIKSFHTRKYDTAHILLRLMFASPLHRDALLASKYAKYVP